MDEEELRNLLSSISHLAMHGDVPVQAFGPLISSARGELIAEHLHQRWLAYPNFAKIAAEIVFQLHGVENRNVTVCSQVLALALRDFRSRRKIRKRSRHMFRNYFRTLVELFPVYRQMDKYLSSCLIEPLFRCLQMLVDNTPDDSDLRCVANVMITSGQVLNQLNPMECDRAMMNCRKWLASNSIELQETTKYLLFNALDLWMYSWDVQSFPDCLRRFYEEHDRSQDLSLFKRNSRIGSTESNIIPPDEHMMKQRASMPVSTTRVTNGDRRAESWEAADRTAIHRLRRQPSVTEAHVTAPSKAPKSVEESDSDKDRKSEKPSYETLTSKKEKNVTLDQLNREESVV